MSRKEGFLDTEKRGWNHHVLVGVRQHSSVSQSPFSRMFHQSSRFAGSESQVRSAEDWARLIMAAREPAGLLF
jgi:hypothetical protein